MNAYGQVVPARLLTSRQETTIDILRSLEARETLGSSRRYSVSCNECGTGFMFAAADSARQYIQRHAGHRGTWLDYVR
jgi:hypothetical protein